jgi:hypothetical protein
MPKNRKRRIGATTALAWGSGTCTVVSRGYTEGRGTLRAPVNVRDLFGEGGGCEIADAKEGENRGEEG